MGDNMDKYKNDKRDVTKMGLAQADKASVTKLSGMDSTDRKQKWEKIKVALKRESGSDSHSFRYTEEPPTAEKICQLPIYIANYSATNMDKAKKQIIAPEKDHYFREAHETFYKAS